jgi:hypothetical protein
LVLLAKYLGNFPNVQLANKYRHIYARIYASGSRLYIVFFIFLLLLLKRQQEYLVFNVAAQNYESTKKLI